MLASLLPVLYVQISPQQLTVRNAKTGQQITTVPELAIAPGPPPKIMAVGQQARQAAASAPAVEIVNPFSHPRTLASDFTAAEQLLRHQVRQLIGNTLLTPSPRIVIHPLGAPEGGFTQIERRAFREMALGAGAAKAHVWTGRPLSDQEILAGTPPQAGGDWE